MARSTDPVADFRDRLSIRTNFGRGEARIRITYHYSKYLITSFGDRQWEYVVCVISQ